MDSSSSTFLSTTTIDQRKQSLLSRKQPKKQKKKTTTTTTSIHKPIKVRYISNPMRVKTCASKFRELVQELTGQDAVEYLQQDQHIYSPNNTTENLSSPCVVVDHQETLDDRVVECNYEPLDGEEEEMFLPQISAGFSGFFLNGFCNVNEYFASIDSM